MVFNSATATIVQTLLSAGFRIISTDRGPSYIAFAVRRSDEFGVENRTLLAFGSNLPLSDTDVSSLEKLSRRNSAPLVIIGKTATRRPDLPLLTMPEFMGRLGGSVTALLPLEPEYSARIDLLGHNALPKGLIGKADDRFEEYVHAGLQFILGDRVIRYGQERRFEALPDGLAVGPHSPRLLYDAKAAQKGYKITKQSLRQFGDYVRNFHAQYESYTGRLHCFLVVSGDFISDENLENRSQQMYADCGIPLSFLKSCDLAKIVLLLTKHIAYRQAIDWTTIFSKPVIASQAVRKNLQSKMRDNVIRKK